MEKDMLDFYDKILNIGSYNNLSKIESILENLKIDSKIYDVEGLCKWFSNNISYELTKEHIFHNIISTRLLGSTFEHEFIISLINDDTGGANYYIIDPSYLQFLTKENEILNPKLLNRPSIYLESTKEGNELLEKLIKYGYSIIDNNQLSLYLKGFGINDIDLDELLTSKNITR